MSARRTRLGWLGPVLVAIAAAVAAVGVWYMVHAKPKAGAVIDTIALGDNRTVVVRAEEGGDRAFIELRDGEQVKWQALVPPYGGRPGAPGIAFCATSVSVRVVRDGHAELFALSMENAMKLGGVMLAPQHGPIINATTGPVTLTDGFRSYEVVSGPDWHQLVAVDLKTGRALWYRELGPKPVIGGGIIGGVVWVDQGAGPLRYYVFNGAAEGNPKDKAL